MEPIPEPIGRANVSAIFAGEVVLANELDVLDI